MARNHISRLILATLIIIFLQGCLNENEILEGTAIGNKAPELESYLPDSSTFRLSNLSGKLILLDFWGSACKPCRLENPNLVELYNEFRDQKFSCGKGFEIVSFSLDTKKDNWLSAIQKDSLTWNSQVSSLKGWDSEVVSTYKIRSIPASFLLDGEGVIIARNLRGIALRNKLKELLSE